MHRLEIPAAGLPLDDERADRLWHGWTPQRVAEELSGCGAHWMVAGGWAIELFLDDAGSPKPREHEDLELAVPAAEFAQLRDRLARGGRQWVVAGNGRLWPLASPAFEECHQTWLWDDATEGFVVDVFREPGDGKTWVCRRDERLTLPMSRVRRISQHGIPYVAPEVVLLFKAKHLRDKDTLDFDRALPLLDAGARQWLRAALALVHPVWPEGEAPAGAAPANHPWMAQLEKS